MQDLKVIAVTHKDTELTSIGKYHLDEDQQASFLPEFKRKVGAGELMFLSTCNRVEFIMTHEKSLDEQFLNSFFRAFFGNKADELVKEAVNEASIYQEKDALEHLFRVSSSLDSMVIGEREIITQVRRSYDRCRDLGLTGDLIRLVIDGTIRTAKEVYSNTRIAVNPVSVVSLAYKKLQKLDVDPSGRVVVIGSGKTNTSFCRFLKKHGFTNFTIYNRTLENAEPLARELEGEAKPLSELKNEKGDFDVLVTCTGAQEPIITSEMLHGWDALRSEKKVIVDLSLPSDIEEGAIKEYAAHYIGLSELKDIADKNLKEREKELNNCEKIIQRNLRNFDETYREREVELAMREVPQKVKEIRKTAVEGIFADEIEQLDENSREVLEKVVQHLEKKYISVPMKMAREILLEEQKQSKRPSNSR